MKIIICMACFALLLNSFYVRADNQDAKQTGSKVEYAVRLLTVGSPPPLKIEHRDGQRVQVPPAKGSIPPLSLFLKSSGDTIELSPRLGRVSQTCLIKLNEQRSLEFHKVVPKQDENSDADEVPWWETRLPVGKKVLVLLYKKHNAKNWAKPSGLCLRDEVEIFPVNSIRVVNVSALPVVVKIDDDKPSELKPGKHVVYQRPKAEFEFGLYVKNNKGQYVRLYKKYVHNRKHNRTNVILYSKKPRSQGKPPIGVQVMTDKNVN